MESIVKEKSLLFLEILPKNFIEINDVLEVMDYKL